MASTLPSEARVVVIGAGLAGLQAASTLTAALSSRGALQALATISGSPSRVLWRHGDACKSSASCTRCRDDMHVSPPIDPRERRGDGGDARCGARAYDSTCSCECQYHWHRGIRTGLDSMPPPPLSPPQHQRRESLKDSVVASCCAPADGLPSSAAGSLSSDLWECNARASQQHNSLTRGCPLHVAAAALYRTRALPPARTDGNERNGPVDCHST
jgi:hypothetical protein